MSDAPTTELENISKPPATPETVTQATIPPENVTKESARAALESIAKPEQTPNVEQIDRILTQASQTYLDQGDNRLLLTALARAAGDTPLGLEFKRDTLAMIDPKHEGLIPKSETNQFAAFLEQYNKAHPGAEISGEGNPEVITRALQENSAFSEALWTELIGKDTPRPLLTTADGLLQAAGVEKNDTNRTRAEALFKPLRVKKDFSMDLGKAVPTILGGAMLLSFITQLAMTDSGQSQGH